MGNYTDDDMRNFGADPDVFQEQFHNISGRTDVKFDLMPWHSYFRQVVLDAVQSYDALNGLTCELYRPNIRMVSKFSEGRVFIVGG